MISIEVNVVCDGCTRSCVTGEPVDDLEAAISSAYAEACDNRWTVRFVSTEPGEAHIEAFCSDCSRRLGKL